LAGPGNWAGLYIEDAMAVQAHLEKRMSERIKEHAAFIERHEEFIQRHKILMTEFDDKLNAPIDVVRHCESGSAHD